MSKSDETDLLEVLRKSIEKKPKNRIEISVRGRPVRSTIDILLDNADLRGEVAHRIKVEILDDV